MRCMKLILYVLTCPIWIAGILVALLAFAVGGIVPIVNGAYVAGGEFASWVFGDDRPNA